MTKLICFAAPVLPGKEAEHRDFLNQLKGSRFADFKAVRDKYGVRERSYLQRTPDGHSFSIVTLEGKNPEGIFASFNEGKDEFTRWFVDTVKIVHGIDLTQPMPMEFPEMIVDTGA